MLIFLDNMQVVIDRQWDLESLIVILYVSLSFSLFFPLLLRWGFSTYKGSTTIIIIVE